MEQKYLGIIIGISILAVAIISYEYVLTPNLNTDEKNHEIPVNQTLPISQGKNYSINLNENVGLTSKKVLPNWILLCKNFSTTLNSMSIS